MLVDNMVREQVNTESPEMLESGMLLLIPVGENVQIWDTEKHAVSLMQANTIVMQWIAPFISVLVHLMFVMFKD